VTTPRRIFAFWLGDATMSDNRKRALDSLANTGVTVEFLTDADVDQWVVPGEPLHPAWPHLSAVHRADYLRTYLMHHHGGGYTDLKPTPATWSPTFDVIDDRGLLGAGYPEVGRYAVANIGVDFSRGPYRSALSAKWWHLRWLRLNYRNLLGNCAYIFRPGTDFTTDWFRELQGRLDALLPALEAHPARDPREKPGQMIDGSPSRYPVPWTHLLGAIFHPLTYRYRRQLDRGLPPPSFRDYV
jgi:hypothetical protein